jgi:excisionase family DNA binding protein
MRKAAPRPRRPASVAGGAAYAGIGKRTVYRYIAEGRLTGYRFGPKLIRVDLDELDRLSRR